MKKFVILSLVVAFALLGAQAFASPPIAPPIEGFIIESYTKIDCVGDVSESENYNWTYFEGTGPLNPGEKDMYTTVQDIADYLIDRYAGLTDINPVTFPAYGNLTVSQVWPQAPAAIANDNFSDWVDWILAHAGGAIVLADLGFQEGAEIAYQQEFNAVKGSTFFEKTFKAVSHTNTTTPDNLQVDKTINYDDAGDGVTGDGNATHTEKVAMNVVSAGSKGGDIVTEATSLLHLCPWATETTNTVGTKGYPPTNEGVAAGSEFNVTKINFKSSSTVNTVNNPALAYNVEAEGTGSIKAGFVVDLWEGREGDTWGSSQPHQPWLDLINGVLATHGLDPILGGHPDIVWVADEGAPDLASRTSYVEHASADGVWKFQKKVSYESVMPGLTTTSSSIPINNVP